MERFNSEDEKKKLEHGLMRQNRLESADQMQKDVQRSYYERYKEGLENELAKIQLPDLTEFENKLSDESDDREDERYAIQLLRQLKVRDMESVLHEVAKSPQKVEDLRDAISSGERYRSQSNSYIEITHQLLGTVERLVLMEYPEIEKQLYEWHKKKDAEQIEAAKERLRNTKIS